MRFTQPKRQKSRLKLYILITLALIIVVLLAGAGIVHKKYSDDLKPVGTEKKSHVITIKPGSTASQIADDLVAEKIIRSDWSFEWYIRNNKLYDSLKAGTYVVYENQSVQEIVQIIIDGKEATDLITILPAQRLDQVRAALIKGGFSESEVDAALEPTQYASHPVLADKPAAASLEGYLYPESFQKTPSTTAKEVIEQSLDQMQLFLTDDVRAAYKAQGMTVYEGIILASVVEQEVNNKPDRAQAAQVFVKRLKIGMPLGSDPTAFYGAILDGKEPSVFYDSPYNTRLHALIPPGPIGNITESSLLAVAHPADTDWLYFVAGDDGTTHFSKTIQEHEALTRQYCTKLCN